jgi:two-component system, cell cycle sensor histidine kinase and response regulator CckA
MSDVINNRGKVLVIEDEPGIVRVCARTLTAEGYEVDVAVNGLVAKDMSDKKEYDPYFSDIRTPQMNGMEFYEYLKRAHPGMEHRVVFTTGDSLNPQIKDFLEVNRNAFLAKPFTPSELRTTLKQALEKLQQSNHA